MLRWEGRIIIGDYEEVVEEGSLELMEEQVQCVRKQGVGEEKQVLAALAHMEELISDQRQLEFKENQDACPITEVEVLNVNETKEIREIYREVCEIPEKPSGVDLETKQEIENGWKDMEEIQEVNSADQIDQLNASQFKMQSGKYNLPRGEKAMKFWKTQRRVCGRKFPRGGLQQIWGRF